MSGFDLLAASIGLAVSALAAALLLPLWRRSPVPAYRLVVSVLAAALALPLLQWAARALDLPVPHPARALALALRADVAAQLEPTSTAAPLVLALEPGGPSAAPFAGAVQPESVPVADPTGAVPEARAASPSTERPWPWTTIALAAWAAGALCALARTLRRLLAAQRLFARARPVADPAQLAVWDTVRAGSRTGARTRLCESAEVRTPACAGLLRPAVVLPADDSLAGRPELLACVLTHELVHLERRDPWVLLGEELLRAAFWFHPAAWWLVARLSALRELSCDCLVVRRTGKRKRYASALVEYATWMQRPAPRASWAAVVPWSESRGHLTRRIEMLLQPQNDTQSGRIVAPAAVGVLMTFLWSGQLALATSSCAGTRSNHEHAHEHAQADEGGASASEPIDVQVVSHDGKKFVVTTTSAGEPLGSPVVVTVQGKPVVVQRVHGESVETDDGDAEDGQVAKHVERCVVVIQDGDGEPQVLRGDEAKAWMEEHGVGVESGKAKRALIEEIRGAKRDAENGERAVVVLGGSSVETKGEPGESVEVIVVGPDGKRLKTKKAGSLFGAQGHSAFGPHVFKLEGQHPGGVWTFGDGGDDDDHDDDQGEQAKGFFRAAPKGYTFQLEPDGRSGSFQGWKLGWKQAEGQGQVHGGVHGQSHGSGFTTPGQGLFGPQGDKADLDALRQELEETRAALEQQRRALEELRQQLQKQREKSGAVGAWTK